MVIIVLTGIGISIFYFQKRDVKPESIKPQAKAKFLAPSEIASIKRLIKSEDIVLEEIDVEPKIPEYNLPLETKDISNYQDFAEKIQLSPQALSILKKNGFVVVPTSKELDDSPDDFAEFYSALKHKDLPIFITTDSLLHYYHIFFDTTLMKLERDLFYDDIWQMSKEFFDDAVQYYNLIPEDGKNSKDLREAAKRNIAYLSVALELLSPEKSQIISDENFKKEYCSSEMSAYYCKTLIDRVKKQYNEKSNFKYFSKSEFDKYNFEIPDFVESEVKKEIKLIKEHNGWKFSPIFIYKEDYSQYAPRGHYTKSEKLKNYFMAMMWYSRMTALIKGSEDLPTGKSLRKIQEQGVIMNGEKGLISVYDAKIQTFQASLIAKKFLESKSIQDKWNRMYAVTGFFVGISDDLGPYEYGSALKALSENEITFQEIRNKYPDIKNKLLDISYNPKIYSGLDQTQLVMPCPPLSDQAVQELKTQGHQILENTKGFRLMGQRFTIDSWLFSEIVSPYSGEYNGQRLNLPTNEKPFTFFWNDFYQKYRKNRPFTWVKTNISSCPDPAEREVRGFPRGLDIMALFGSKKAKEILEKSGDTEYSDYENKFSELKAEIDSMPADSWYKNLYWNWLYVLKSLLNEFGEGHQTFMQTQSWQDKELNTALASWAELRHDTLLYVKQSYTVGKVGTGLTPPFVGYVEPVPEFYARLLCLVKMTNKGLKTLISEKELEELKIENGLDRFSNILTRLLEISKKELENKELTDEDYSFIENFGSISENLIESVSGGDIDPDALKTVLVVDVHTDGNTEKILEQGIGYIKTLVVAYKMPQGHILLGAGPVFSYYEFKQPIKNRLTDEEWKEMLDTEHPSEPEYIKSFYDF